MTVGDLITLLQTYDPAARAVVSGWHFGYDDIARVADVTIGPAPTEAQDWDGAYADAADGEPAVFLCTTDPKIYSLEEAAEFEGAIAERGAPDQAFINAVAELSETEKYKNEKLLEREAAITRLLARGYTREQIAELEQRALKF